MDQCTTLIHSVTLREWVRVGESDRQTNRHTDRRTKTTTTTVSSEQCGSIVQSRLAGWQAGPL